MMEGYTILQLLLCLSVASAFSDNDVRLVGTDSNERMGRVEIYRYGEWGTVCDEGWDIVEARVVCIQLGFYKGADYTKNFGQGSGEILFTNVECTGNENKITDCPFSSAYSCTHSQDAGVACRGNSIPGGRRKMEDLELYGKKEEEVAAEERSDDKKDADLKKKDVLQALYDLLAELEDK